VSKPIFLETPQCVAFNDELHTQIVVLAGVKNGENVYFRFFYGKVGDTLTENTVLAVIPVREYICLTTPMPQSGHLCVFLYPSQGLSEAVVNVLERIDDNHTRLVGCGVYEMHDPRTYDIRTKEGGCTVIPR